MRAKSRVPKSFYKEIMPFCSVFNIMFCLLIFLPACASSVVVTEAHKLDVSILFNTVKCKAKPECKIEKVQTLLQNVSVEESGNFWLIHSLTNGISMMVGKGSYGSDQEIVVYARPGKAWNIVDLTRVFGTWTRRSSSKTHWIVFKLSSDWTKGFPVNVYAELSLSPENDAAQVRRVKIRTVSD